VTLSHTRRQPIPWRTLRDPGHFLSLGAGAGLLPWTPGTWGSLVGVGLFYLLQPVGELAYWSTLGALFAVGIPLCGRTSRTLGVKDHGAIVWDEIVGVMITLGLCATSVLTLWAGFAAFRILDIWKPWPISLLDQRLAGGFGVMADDLAAGMVAGLAILLFKYLS
jgi:phosphatidylglycerophosphatase A